MKRSLTLLTCILCHTTFAQFAIIADKDGFVNVRNSPNTPKNIIDTLANGQIVYCLEEEGEWWATDYHLNLQSFNTGYIHKSRVKFIDSFSKMHCNKLTDSIAIFKQDSIKLIITKTKFNPKKNKLEYSKADASKNEMIGLKKINGKDFWGTDGEVPKNQYGQATLSFGKNKIHLPIDNLFEPNIGYTTVNIDKKNNVIYISALNSDGAGGYVVLWIIENGIFKERLITHGF